MEAETTRDGAKTIPVADKNEEKLVRGTNYLLAIAIDDYQHNNRLYNCVKDVEEISNLLTTKYTFAKENVRKLYNPDATAENILKALDNYSRIAQKEDNLIIMYSGHGDNRNNIGFWIPCNAQQFTDYLPLSTVLDYLEQINARHILILADACFAGRFFSSTRGGDGAKPAEGAPSRYALTAGRDQPVLDGKPGSNSPFADALKAYLSKEQNAIGAVELAEKIVQKVARETKNFQTPRHGTLNMHGQGEGQFYFHQKQGVDAQTHLDISKLLIYLGEQILDEGIFRSAIKHLDYANDQAKLTGAPIHEVLYWQGKALQGAGDYAGAMPLFAQFLEAAKDALPPPKNR